MIVTERLLPGPVPKTAIGVAQGPGGEWAGGMVRGWLPGLVVPWFQTPWLPGLITALGWLGWSVLVGYWGHRLPLAALDHDRWWSRPRPWGESPAFYEQGLAIRRWKTWLPDAGALFPGGLRKRALIGRNRPHLEQLLAETRRAEAVHLLIWPFWLATALWLPPIGVAANLLFATLFNLPCLWLQRYTRLRVMLLLARLESGGPSA